RRSQQSAPTTDKVTRVPSSALLPPGFPLGCFGSNRSDPPGAPRPHIAAHPQGGGSPSRVPAATARPLADVTAESSPRGRRGPPAWRTARAMTCLGRIVEDMCGGPRSRESPGSARRLRDPSDTWVPGNPGRLESHYALKARGQLASLGRGGRSRPSQKAAGLLRRPRHFRACPPPLSFPPRSPPT
ncbi:unnamed protein product, partial [Prorocentrum cordatum]